MTEKTILTRDKNTGLLARYPEIYLKMFPNLECAETDAEVMCADCVFIPEPEPQEEIVALEEPTPRKRTKK